MPILCSTTQSKRRKPGLLQSGLRTIFIRGSTPAQETQTWVWMSALLDRTKAIPVGTGLTAPIRRYHPAIIAQAFASMEAIFGKRVFLTLGAGEALNEPASGLRLDGPPGKKRAGG